MFQLFHAEQYAAEPLAPYGPITFNSYLTPIITDYLKRGMLLIARVVETNQRPDTARIELRKLHRPAA